MGSYKSVFLTNCVCDSDAQIELSATNLLNVMHGTTCQVLKDFLSRGKRHLRDQINKDRCYNTLEKYLGREGGVTDDITGKWHFNYLLKLECEKYE